jgi:NADH dehydrogenase
MTRKQILVLGGGFGGMYTARRLERRLPAGEAEIVLINVENYMLYTPLLPEAAAGTIEPRHVVVPLRQALRRTRLRVGTVTGVDIDRRTCTYITAALGERTLSWDRLVVALGSVSRILPIPGLAEHARGFKTPSEAIYLRNHTWLSRPPMG